MRAIKTHRRPNVNRVGGAKPAPGWDTEQKIETATGVRSEGFSNKVFTSYREVMAPGAFSAKVRHPKKAKTLFIVGGEGTITVTPEGGEESVNRLIPSSFVTLNPGDTYQLRTIGTSHLEFLVAQEARYEAHLEVLEEAKVVALPDSMRQTMEDPLDEDEVLPRQRVLRGNNTKTQQLMWERRAAALIRAGEEPPAPPPGMTAEGAQAVIASSPGKVEDLGPTSGINARALTDEELMRNI